MFLFEKTMFRRSLPKVSQLLVPVAVILIFAGRSAAQTSWLAASSGNWNTATNWTPAVVPAQGTNASITNSGTFTVTYNSPMAATSIGSLTLGLSGESTSIPTLTITASGFNVSGSTTLTGTSAEVLNVNSGGVMTNGTLDFNDYNAVVNVSGVMTNGTTEVANNGSDDGTAALQINSGAVANLGTVTVGRNDQSSSYGLQIAGGTVSASSIAVGTENSYATMAVSGGTLTNAGSLQMGTGSATAGREVRYYQTGGTVSCAGTMDMAVAASYTTWFSVLNSSSTFSAAGIRIFPNAVSGVVAYFTNSGNIYLGATGFNVLNSGTYTVTLNNQSLLGATTNWSGNANMVTGSGTVTFKTADASGNPHNITLTNVISGAAGLTETGGGTLALHGANTYAGATTVSAGLLSLQNTGALPKGTALTLGGSGTAGILDLAGFNVQISGLATAGTAASQIITNSSTSSTSTLTFSNSAANSTFGGVIAGASKPIALTLLGGNLTLSGTNSYGGNLFISKGKLALSGAGSTFTGAAVVLSNSAAILDVSGMGGITLGAGQSLSGYGVVTGSVAAANCPVSPGAAGTAGTLSFSNNLALNGGVTNSFGLALEPNSPGNDLIVVGGTLNVSGTNTIQVSLLGTSLSAGTYTLIEFGSLGSGGATNFQVTGTFGTGLQATVSVTTTAVDLIVSEAGGTQRTWVGDGLTNAWDYTSVNWLDGVTPDTYSDGDFVTFDDTGSSTPPVDLTTVLQPAGVFVNATSNYTFSGVGEISGTATLTKTNSGALTILTTNNYSGVTIIGQGILQLGNGITSGSIGTNVIQNSGLLILNLPGSSTFSNAVSGTGGLVQAGSGTLTLTASNSYSGGTIISNGTLQLNTGAWFGSGNLTNNGVLVLNSSGNSTVSAAISGTGAVTLAGSGTVTLTGNNTYSGGTTVNNGTLLMNNSTGSGTGTGAVTVASGSTLSGSGVIGGAVTINSGGIYAPGNPVGTLTVSNNFTANSGAVLNYTLGTSSDRTIVSSNLNLSGTLNITNGGGFTSGTFTLFTYGGKLTLGALTLALPANASGTINTNTPGQVNLIVASLQSNIPAFPGALGFGANAWGARFGGTVYHVTNTNDSGAGSFRDAVSEGNRFVVFDVGGTITLASAVSCSSSLTIAGQTAPGGIAIIGHEVSFSVQSNCIVRYLRIRPGSIASSTEDGINMGDATNMIFDHVSVEFAPYNSIDAHGNYTCGNQITIQNSILADPIGQQFNAHTEASNNTFSWFYNIFSSGHDRNPLAKVNTIFINNIVNNFQAGYTVADTGGNFSHDIINNYFIMGPGTTDNGNDAFFQFDSNQSVYASGNLENTSLNGTLGGGSIAPGGVTVLNSPWSSLTPNIPKFSTFTAYRYVVSMAGALPQDRVDQNVLGDVTSLGTAGAGGGLWTTQTATGLGNDGYGVIIPGTLPVDTDDDGMADYWKMALGLNLTNGADALTAGAGGYTHLENYLNWLAGPNAVASNNSFVDVDLMQYTGGFTNASPVYSVLAPTNGTVALLADGHTAQFTAAENFSGLGSFNFSVRASDGSAMTNTVAVLVLAAATGPQNLTWRGDGLVNNWDTTSTNWVKGTNMLTFGTGDTVTFDNTGSNTPAINLVGSLQPASVTVAASQNYTFSGSGSLGGGMALTNSGTGTLTLNETNSYTGGTVVNGGSIVFSVGAAIPPGGALTLNNTGAVTVVTANSLPTVTVNGANSITGNGSSGTGIATLNDAGTLTLFASGGANVFDLTGAMSGSGNLVLGSPAMTLRFNGTAGDGAAIFNLGTVTAVANVRGTTTTAIALGGLTGGSGTQLQGDNSSGGVNMTYTIGGANANTEFDGVIKDGTVGTVALTETGTGSLTLTGTNAYSGGTTVSSGALLVNNTTGSGTGSGSVTVASGATLGGTGAVSGNVTWQSGALASFSSSSALTAGVVSLNGNTVTVNIPGSTPLSAGSYTLMNYTVSGSSGTFNATPVITGAGLAGADTATVTTGGGKVSLVVSKTTPILETAPTAMAITYGQALSASTLSVGVFTNTAGTKVSGAFAFTVPTAVPGAGTASQSVTFTPTDTADYNTVSFNVSVTVNPLVVILTGTRVYDGTTNAPAAILSVANTVGNDNVTVASGTAGLAAATVGTNSISSLGSLALGGTAAANYTLKGAGGSVIITPATASMALASSENPSGYSGNVTFSATVTGVDTPTGTVQFLTNGVNFDEETLSNGFASSVGTALLPVGTNTITAAYSGDENYLAGTNNLSQVVTLPQFQTVGFGSVGLGMSGSGGPTNGIYYVLGSTNIALPVNLWPRIATNLFDASGNFNFTNVVDPSTVQIFYQLQLP